MIQPSENRGLARMKQRRQFLDAAAARRKWASPGMVVQVRSRKVDEDPTGLVRVGFTTSKKVGNAVTRNRVRRRLRACADDILPLHAKAGLDIVLIGRQGTVQRSFEDLKGDLLKSLRKLDAAAGSSGGAK